MNGDGTLQPTNGRMKDSATAAVIAAVDDRGGGAHTSREIIKISDCTSGNNFPERGKSTRTG